MVSEAGNRLVGEFATNSMSEVIRGAARVESMSIDVTPAEMPAFRAAPDVILTAVPAR